MAKRKILAAALCACALLVCQSARVKEPIVKVGKTTLGSESLETLVRAAGVYPMPMPSYFPAQRQATTFMAECEAIYQRAGAKSAEIDNRLNASLDWTWKKRYYAAVQFFDLLPDNLGFTDKHLEDYYKKSAEAFRVTVTTAEGKDSSYIPPFDSVKTQVADRCFYDAHKPDSAFIARLSEQDSVAVMNQWIYTVRSNPPDFFMRLLFKERTGSEYADSLEQLYDEKILTTADMDLVASWLPESRKNMLVKDRAEWLFKWLAFSEYAEKIGITATPKFKEWIHWVRRMEFAFEYLRSEVIPGIEPASAATGLDTTLAELIVYDNNFGQTGWVDPRWVASALNDIVKTRIAVKVDSVLYDIRRSVKVTFLQNDRNDEKDANPAPLLARADSLREAAADPDMDPDEAAKIVDEAENLYQTLSSNFAFTADGRRALGEMAKTMIEKYSADPKRGKHLLSTAINAYRKSQKLDADPESLCNSYFMVGFAYDEHLKNYSLAEANYKWILRNAPECNLASDAEFMIQHLGEPMASIEEIQGQSMRQGREIDFDENGDAESI